MACILIREVEVVNGSKNGSNIIFGYQVIGDVLWFSLLWFVMSDRTCKASTVFWLG
jgi:hypothetical protein